ncbi:MAG: hypothetical protein ACOYOU_16765 [Kiritimatiellia bacterium]
MSEGKKKEFSIRPAGYAALIEKLNLDVIPNWHRSMIATGSIHRIDSYPTQKWRDWKMRLSPLTGMVAHEHL